ncbi:phosphatase PAP2 family protein [Pontibacter akesuensis]|uniref:PAP2 superfamily protein n=1 Tax=Pontibacter akesuensis TaxID=388950 RepID=A0A1I7JK99_9BACT|nr:phosphatase PAP2 family protein [Pontibacter akesuensis]SFU85635.1 PAP2 superfamily protein [Pontibacter akesuensis]
MKRLLLLWLIICAFCAQNALGQAAVSPYQTSWLKDGAIIAGGVGASLVGSYLMDKKDKVTLQELAALNKNNVNGLDRFAAGNYSTRAESVSDVFFYGSFATPLLLLLDKDIQQNAPQVYLLYGQAMSIAGGVYSLTTGNSRRRRPYVYAADAPLELRTDKQATNSFYAGHTAATATATFFLAKVYHDFNPDSPVRPYIWAAAASVPATVAYLRLKAGKHFVSDNIVGYVVGASIGILVPELHKRNSSISLLPESNEQYEGVAIICTF